MMREFTVVMWDGCRFFVDATSPRSAEACVIESCVMRGAKYTLSDIMITYEILQWPYLY